MEPHGEKFRLLVDIIFKMTEEQDIDRLLKILLDGALKLVDGTHGSIWRLDYHTGQIKIVHSSPNSNLSLPDIDWGKGVIGQALKEKEPKVVPDVLSDEWKDIYIQDWENMRSEIAIPIFLDNISVRVGLDIQKGSKRIGVLNIESEYPNAFSEEHHQQLLLDLTRYAAIRIEDLESDLKLAKLREKEREIAQDGKDYHQIIDLVITSIIKILKFDIVNISIVNLEKGVIESRHVYGLPEVRKKEFMDRAVHNLVSDDIQADIIRSKKIEVFNNDDPRFDRELASDFEHEKLVRVFMPMIEAANDIAIGTVECGYHREYREFIYERDIQILESFVNHATQALEKRKRDWLETITHEFKNPILGIRNHADRLLNRRHILREDEINAKLEDIITDSAILFYQVRQLEFMLGTNTSPNLRPEEVSVRNEIIKVFKQLKPELRSRGFSNDEIEYQFDDRVRRIKIYTDRARLNQIIYNLLLNSIKYAEEDPSKFKVRIKINKDSKEYLIIRFQDYGVGIKDDETEKIFDLGYKGIEVRHKEQGSGIGLSISRDLITRLGGKLLLISPRNPTEFQIVIPYYLDDFSTTI